MPTDFDLTWEIYGQEPPPPEQGDSPFVLGSQVTIRDEGVLIETNVNIIDLVGSGVSAFRTSSRRVQMNIGPGGGEDPTLILKKNNTGVLISKLKAVSEVGDGSIALMSIDTADGEDFYGVTIADILPGASGLVKIEGVVEGALEGRGWAVETKVYGSTIPGEFDIVPTTTPGRAVYQLGKVTNAMGKDLIISKQFIIRN